MTIRGHTLIDFSPPSSLWPDRDRIVRFMEYVRANFGRIVSGVPDRCEVDLFAGGHVHNPGLVPLLGLWTPAALIDRVPDPLRMVDEVNEWSAALSLEEIERIVANTPALTWEELVRIGVDPNGPHDA